MNFDTWQSIESRMVGAQTRYGDFASTHEALGVACEEWHEFIEAIRSNNMDEVKHECLDLAAVLIRLADSIGESDSLRKRSVK